MAIKKRHVKAVIQLRRAVESDWIRVDPVLRVGEPALSTDVYKIKIGNGTSHWSELDYLNDQEVQALFDKVENLQLSDITHDETVLIDCGTSTTVI